MINSRLPFELSITMIENLHNTFYFLNLYSFCNKVYHNKPLKIVLFKAMHIEPRVNMKALEKILKIFHRRQSHLHNHVYCFIKSITIDHSKLSYEDFTSNPYQDNFIKSVKEKPLKIELWRFYSYPSSTYQDHPKKGYRIFKGFSFILQIHLGITHM